MHLKRLRSFIVAAEEENVGRAARRLGLAQPALTRQLHALEHEVGARLLERHARGVRLTPAGAIFLQHAHAVLAAADVAMKAAREAAARSRMSALRISPPDWPNRARPVQRAVQAFTSETGIEIVYDVTPWVLHPRALEDGAIDIGFGIAMSPDDYGPAIAAHRLLDEPASSAVIAKSHPLASRSSLTLRDLRDTPLMVPTSELAPVLHEQMVNVVRSGGYEPRVVPGPPSFALAAQLIVAGAGWTITTHSVGEEPPHGVSVIPIADAQFMLGFFALRRASDDRPVVLRFIELVASGLEAMYASSAPRR